jgi:hypothetical protein
MGIEVEKFKDIKDDVEFTQKLLAEECVLVLPGTIFQIPNFVRLVRRWSLSVGAWYIVAAALQCNVGLGFWSNRFGTRVQVICPTLDKLRVVCDRLAEFCSRHAREEFRNNE